MFINLRKQSRKQKKDIHCNSFIGLGLLILAAATGCTTVQRTVPTNYQAVAEIFLPDRSFEAETIGEFTVEETAVVSIFYTLPNVDTTYFDLSLVGSDGDSHLILHSEDYQTDENGGGTWEQSLPPGIYRLVLTAHQSPGVLSVYRSSN
jgi:hypothetical protein